MPRKISYYAARPEVPGDVGRARPELYAGWQLAAGATRLIRGGAVISRGPMRFQSHVRVSVQRGRLVVWRCILALCVLLLR